MYVEIKAPTGPQALRRMTARQHMRSVLRCIAALGVAAGGLISLYNAFVVLLS